jgi:hypothetical protein
MSKGAMRCHMFDGESSEDFGFLLFGINVVFKCADGRTANFVT